MTVQMVLDIGQQALLTTLLIAAPMLATSMVIGITISLFQSMTQINEITLTFVPKIVSVMIASIVALPWIVRIISRFTQEMLFVIPNSLQM